MKKVAILNDTRGYHLGCDFVNNNLLELCKKHNLEVKGIFAILAHELEKKLTDVDVIIINGEGTFHHTNGFQLDRVIRVCKGKKSFLINTVYDKPDHKRELNFDLISCRESLSASKIPGSIVVPDLSLYKMPEIKTPEESRRIGYTAGVTPESREMLGILPNHLDMKPILPKTYLRWLNSLDLFVTGRFHGICMAAYYDIPFLAFKSNSHKNEGILKDMGCSELLIEKEEQIAHRMRDARFIISKAHKYAMEAKEKQEKLFERIYQAI